MRDAVDLLDHRPAALVEERLAVLAAAQIELRELATRADALEASIDEVLTQLLER